MPSIDVSFVGNHLILWDPHPASNAKNQLSTSASSLSSEEVSWEDELPSTMPSTNHRLQQSCIKYIKNRIRQLVEDPEWEEWKPRGEALMELYALLTVMHDPSSTAHPKGVQQFEACMEFHHLRNFSRAVKAYSQNYGEKLRGIINWWTENNNNDGKSIPIPTEVRQPQPETSSSTTTNPNKRRKVHHEQDKPEQVNPEPATPQTQKATGRSYADIEAQRELQPLYDGCVLTGSNLCIEGCHIIDVRVSTKIKNSGLQEEALRRWEFLSMLWPLEVLDAFALEGQEMKIILPLNVQAHRAWDTHQFALRPIPHPTDPDHRIYLQFMWLKNLSSAKRNLVDTPFKFGEDGFLDWRRARKNNISCPSDTKHVGGPRLSYIKHANGALRNIFSGPPPPPPNVEAQGITDESYIPSIWEWLIEVALEEKVLTAEGAKLWRECIAREAFEETQPHDS
ncbi:hypothetical protein QBC35DRAFT_461666 [Podospora australis]|uniref:HNH nuclease domain-containing protein n=1 Tax=Podospora australis TaxID=1536484 RepID=A0AAN6WZ07_9PEZI|nr:hypothetical protein QBC35DRAFT_461666 [Podospora australis]